MDRQVIENLLKANVKFSMINDELYLHPDITRLLEKIRPHIDNVEYLSDIDIGTFYLCDEIPGFIFQFPHSTLDGLIFIEWPVLYTLCYEYNTVQYGNRRIASQKLNKDIITVLDYLYTIFMDKMKAMNLKL